MDDLTLGERIAAPRGMTRAQLGRALELSYAEVAAVENDTRPSEVTLAEVLGVQRRGAGALADRVRAAAFPDE